MSDEPGPLHAPTPEASPNARGNGVVSTFKDERARDPEFAAAWDEALEEHADSLVAELYRRATIGDAVPIVSPTGEFVGFKHNRSDTLLLAAVRAHHALFTPRTQTEASVEQTTRVERSKNSLDLEQLSPENQDKLLEIIQSERARREGPKPARNGTPRPIAYRSRRSIGDGCHPAHLGTGTPGPRRPSEEEARPTEHAPHGFLSGGLRSVEIPTVIGTSPREPSVEAPPGAGLPPTPRGLGFLTPGFG